MISTTEELNGFQNAMNQVKEKLDQYRQERLPNAKQSRASYESADTQPRKYVLGINITHQPTSDKKLALVKAAQICTNKIEYWEHWSLLVQAIIAEDSKIEQTKLKEIKSQSLISVSLSGASNSEIPNYEELLMNYCLQQVKLTLDLFNHPNSKGSSLYKKLYPLLDTLAPFAIKAASIIKAFRKEFIVTSKAVTGPIAVSSIGLHDSNDDEFPAVTEYLQLKSCYADSSFITDRYRNDLVLTVYSLLIDVRFQTAEMYRQILFNALSFESLLVKRSCEGSDIIINFTKYEPMVWRAEHPETNDLVSLAKLLITNHEDSPQTIKAIPKRRASFFSIEPVKFEQFIYPIIEDLEKCLENQSANPGMSNRNI